MGKIKANKKSGADVLNATKAKVMENCKASLEKRQKAEQEAREAGGPSAYYQDHDFKKVDDFVRKRAAERGHQIQWDE